MCRILKKKLLIRKFFVEKYRNCRKSKLTINTRTFGKVNIFRHTLIKFQY